MPKSKKTPPNRIDRFGDDLTKEGKDFVRFYDKNGKLIPIGKEKGK